MERQRRSTRQLARTHACSVVMAQPHLVRMIISEALNTHLILGDRQHDRLLRLGRVCKLWAAQAKTIDNGVLAVRVHLKRHVPENVVAMVPGIKELSFAYRKHVVPGLRAYGVGTTDTMWLDDLLATDFAHLGELRSVSLFDDKHDQAMTVEDIPRHFRKQLSASFNNLTSVYLTSWQTRYQPQSLHLFPSTLKHLGVWYGEGPLPLDARTPVPPHSASFTLSSLTMAGCTIGRMRWAAETSKSLVFAGHDCSWMSTANGLQMSTSAIAHVLVLTSSLDIGTQHRFELAAVETLSCARFGFDWPSSTDLSTILAVCRECPSLRTIRIGVIQDGAVADRLIEILELLKPQINLVVAKGRCWTLGRVRRLEALYQGKEQRLTWFTPSDLWLSSGPVDEEKQRKRFQAAVMRPMTTEDDVRGVWADLFANE